jgi:hypothetical protein
MRHENIEEANPLPAPEHEPSHYPFCKGVRRRSGGGWGLKGIPHKKVLRFPGQELITNAGRLSGCALNHRHAVAGFTFKQTEFRFVIIADMRLKPAGFLKFPDCGLLIERCRVRDSNRMFATPTSL